MLDLVIPSETVKFGDHSFEVRGLSLTHMIAIIRAHRVELERLYAMSITGELQANAEAVALSLGDRFGSFAGMVISHGARMPALAETFGNELPFPVQIDALEKIAMLTLSNEGGLEKLMETVVRVLSNLQPRKT